MLFAQIRSIVHNDQNNVYNYGQIIQIIAFNRANHCDLETVRAIRNAVPFGSAGFNSVIGGQT